MLSSSTAQSHRTDEKLDRLFRALSDRTRRKLLSRLAAGPAMVTELAEPFDMSLPAVGKHLRVLENAGLVQRTINGRVHRCALDARPLIHAEQWLTQYQEFWHESLDALSDYIKNDVIKR